MRTAITRLRAAACAGLAVAILFTVVPATFAATPAAPEFATGQSDIAGLPVELSAALLSGGAQTAIRDVLTPPTLLLSGAATLTTTPATAFSTAAAKVVAAAKTHLGARYVYGAKGPRVFDCIGLVLRTFSEAGVLSKVGGWANSSGYSLYAWGRRHHLTSTSAGQPGDVVVWGGGAHVGIYLGNGMAISALVSGVRIHGIRALTNRFTAFIHTGLTAVQVKAVTKAPEAKSIGVRYAGPSLALRTAHSTDGRTVSTLKSGTKLTLLSIWKDAQGRTWYRVNADTHVGWVAGWLTRA